MVPQIKNGILNIDKPQGITSHDVVDIVRKIFPGIKVGHTGTLDPIATGVLPICIGKATKLSDELLSENKVYKVKMLLGVETDTYDITGKIVFANTLNEDEIYIKERIKRFIGKSSQIPPIYSAIKIKGKKAYEYARNGENVSLKPREIEIFNIDDIDVNLRKRQVSFVVSCTKGTYIRSLVHDIGIKLGCGATMIELKRLKTGDFDINDSIDLYEFLNLEYLDMLDKIVSIEELYKDSKKINLKDKDYDKFLNGIAIKTDVPNGIVRVYENLRYKGLGKVNDNLLKRFIIE
ncbi:tRNA pseudouridine synthase B [Clostridium sp. CAG:465]|jgi:tRNA pseudouridine synthase B|nr:tRNA pseudouridine synthase B [Clostridium sp. CAG:465]